MTSAVPYHRHGGTARRTLPHPALFTKGSRWRFVSRRHIFGTGQQMEEGEEFEVVMPYNNTTKVLAIRSSTIFEFRSRGHEAFYGKNKQVTATLNYNEIYRFVEQTGSGLENIYYLRQELAHCRYYTGKDSEPTHHDFSMAQYWENPLLAQKKALRQNNVGSNAAYYPRWIVYRYNNRLDEHEEVPFPPALHGLLKWFSKYVAGRVQRMEVEKVVTDIILRNPTVRKLIAVKMPSHTQKESLVYFCGGARLKKPIIVDRYAFFDKIEDAMMVKMGWNATGNVQILEITPGSDVF